MFTTTTTHTHGTTVTEHATYEEAKAAAELRSPDRDDTTIPTIDPALADDATYEAGVFWFGNRYAVIAKV